MDFLFSPIKDRCKTWPTLFHSCIQSRSLVSVAGDELKNLTDSKFPCNENDPTSQAPVAGVCFTSGQRRMLIFFLSPRGSYPPLPLPRDAFSLYTQMTRVALHQRERSWNILLAAYRRNQGSFRYLRELYTRFLKLFTCLKPFLRNVY